MTTQKNSLGIDFGTRFTYIYRTGSDIALGPVPQPVEDYYVTDGAGGYAGIPTVVGIDDHGKWLAGKEVETALSKKTMQPENCVYFLKNKLRAWISEGALKPEEDFTEEERINYGAYIKGEYYNAITLIGRFFQCIFQTDKAYRSIKKIVVGKPAVQSGRTNLSADYGDCIVEILSNLKQKGGGQVFKNDVNIWCVEEPLLAARAYLPLLEEGEICLVVDFGGGTSDYTLIRKIGDGIKVLAASQGAEFPSGIDIDKLIASGVLEILKKRAATPKETETFLSHVEFRKDIEKGKEKLYLPKSSFDDDAEYQEYLAEKRRYTFTKKIIFANKSYTAHLALSPQHAPKVDPDSEIVFNMVDFMIRCKSEFFPTVLEDKIFRGHEAEIERADKFTVLFVGGTSNIEALREKVLEKCEAVRGGRPVDVVFPGDEKKEVNKQEDLTYANAIAYGAAMEAGEAILPAVAPDIMIEVWDYKTCDWSSGGLLLNKDIKDNNHGEEIAQNVNVCSFEEEDIQNHAKDGRFTIRFRVKVGEDYLPGGNHSYSFSIQDGDRPAWVEDGYGYVMFVADRVEDHNIVYAVPLIRANRNQKQFAKEGGGYKLLTNEKTKDGFKKYEFYKEYDGEKDLLLTGMRASSEIFRKYYLIPRIRDDADEEQGEDGGRTLWDRYKKRKCDPGKEGQYGWPKTVDRLPKQ